MSQNTLTTARARFDKALDAEREALLWCIAASGATEEARAAREAHLMTVRVDLAQARLDLAGATA